MQHLVTLRARLALLHMVVKMHHSAMTPRPIALLRRPAYPDHSAAPPVRPAKDKMLAEQDSRKSPVQSVLLTLPVNLQFLVSVPLQLAPGAIELAITPNSMTHRKLSVSAIEAAKGQSGGVKALHSALEA